MVRRTGPDEAYRTVYTTAGLLHANGMPVQLFADANGTTPADVLTEAGATLPVVDNARITSVDSTSGIPRLQYPANGSELIYCSVNGGPITALLSDRKQRDDELAAINLDVRTFGAVGDDNGTSGTDD